MAFSGPCFNNFGFFGINQCDSGSAPKANQCQFFLRQRKKTKWVRINFKFDHLASFWLIKRSYAKRMAPAACSKDFLTTRIQCQPRSDKFTFLISNANLAPVRKVAIFKIVNISAGKLCSTGIKLIAFRGKANTTKSLLDANLADDGCARFIKFCNMNFVRAIACMKDCKVFATGVDHHVNGKITQRDLLACGF